MKKSTIVGIAYLISFLLAIPATKVLAQTRTIYTDSDMKENAFSYHTSRQEYYYNYQEVHRDIVYFTEHFKLQPDGTTPLTNLSFYISIKSINRILADLKSSRKYDPDTNYACLKMYFGMTTKGIMELIIIPVALTPLDNSTTSCAVDQLDKYFITDSVGELLDGRGVANDSITFRNQVWIEHMTNVDDHNFDTSRQYPRGDTYYTIIPIQQMLAMYSANSLSSNRKPEDRIQLNIGATNLMRNSYGNFKVHVIASYNMRGPGNPVNYNYKDMGADFTQMCPPACLQPDLPVGYLIRKYILPTLRKKQKSSL